MLLCGVLRHDLQRHHADMLCWTCMGMYLIQTGALRGPAYVHNVC